MDVPVQNPGVIRLHFRTVGDPGAPPLLLMHGITGSSRYWDRAEEDLGRRYRLYIPDLVGFGESPKPDRDYTIPLYVDTLRTFLQEREIAEGPIRVVGHSLGAIVALEYLSRFPGHYLSGDAGFKDDDGYVSIMSRIDDIINVAGHRLSTEAMEETPSTNSIAG